MHNLQDVRITSASYTCNIGHSSFSYDYYNGSMSDYLQMQNSVRHVA